MHRGLLLLDYVRIANVWEVTAAAEVEALFMYNEIVKEKCYMKNGIAIQDGAVVVDVGANVGQSSCSLLCLSQAMTSAKVLAVVIAVEVMGSNTPSLKNDRQHELWGKCTT